MAINIGLSDQERLAISDGLRKLLADSYVLYLKTQGFHWNVTGPMFTVLHALFEDLYTDLAEAVDEIAERIRALGEFAPGSYAQFLALASITEEKGVPSANEMVQQLIDGQEAVIRTARKIFQEVEKANDQPTADLLTRRMLTHEKYAWMLRSILEK